MPKKNESQLYAGVGKKYDLSGPEVRALYHLNEAEEDRRLKARSEAESRALNPKRRQHGTVRLTEALGCIAHGVQPVGVVPTIPTLLSRSRASLTPRASCLVSARDAYP